MSCYIVVRCDRPFKVYGESNCASAVCCQARTGPLHLQTAEVLRFLLQQAVRRGPLLALLQEYL